MRGSLRPGDVPPMRLDRAARAWTRAVTRRRLCSAAVVRHAHHAAGPDSGDRRGLLLEAVEGLPAKVLLNRACGVELLVLGGVTAAQGSRRPMDHISPVVLACLRAAPCPVVVVTSPAELGSVAELGSAAQLGSVAELGSPEPARSELSSGVELGSPEPARSS